MLIAFILLLIFGAYGYYRAVSQGGAVLDGLQYGAAHGIPAALIGFILMTVIAHLGWLA